jgi:hypothetical protein
MEASMFGRRGSFESLKRLGWWLASASVLSLCTTAASAQRRPKADDTVDESDESDSPEGAHTAASSTAPVTVPPAATISTGAPQPPSQNLASPLPSPPSTGAPMVTVGGGMILLYANNYAPEFDPGGNRKKHIFDVWRASIVLDSKLDRYGIHIEFRARDRSLRWMPVNAWLEEVYASVAVVKPGSAYGPLVLKVGKVFSQFGRFWDNSFYGNIHLRDGLKLVPNWGLSLEGSLGTGKGVGAKYFVQYFVVDGQTSTANTNRDTISIVQPGTANVPIGARKRDDLVVRFEPSFGTGPTMNIKLGASFEYFTADYPDTFSPAAVRSMSRIRDRDNYELVKRYSADVAGQLGWFGFWAEYTWQDGRHTNAFPFAPVADNPATPMVNEARAGSGSDDVTYWLAGANLTYDRFTLQYNYNSAEYKNVEVVTSTQRVKPRGTHKEWIHNPSFSIKLNDQLRFLLEFPFWIRKPVPGLSTQDPSEPLVGTGKQEVVEQQVIATLHGKF